MLNITARASPKPLDSKKRKIEPGPNETQAEEPVFSPTSTPGSTPLLPLEAAPFDSSPNDYAHYLGELSQPESNRLSRAVAQNVAAAGAWELLLPRLVYPLMEQEQGRRNLGPAERPTKMPCLCLQKEAKVLVISFTSMYHQLYKVLIIATWPLLAITPVLIQYCKCTHPAIALIRQGAFTSTPVNPPRWAFNLQYLAFVREQFLAGILNYSAWCNAAVTFLRKEGCQQVPSAVSNRKGQAHHSITNQFSSQLLLSLFRPV